MREPTALLGLAVDGAPSAVDAARAVVDHLAADGRLIPAVYLARSGRLRRVATSGQWLAEDGIPASIGAIGRAYRTGSEVVRAGGAVGAGGVVGASGVGGPGGGGGPGGAAGRRGRAGPGGEGARRALPARERVPPDPRRRPARRRPRGAIAR